MTNYLELRENRLRDKVKEYKHLFEGRLDIDELHYFELKHLLEYYELSKQMAEQEYNAGLISFKVMLSHFPLSREGINIELD